MVFGSKKIAGENASEGKLLLVEQISKGERLFLALGVKEGHFPNPSRHALMQTGYMGMPIYKGEREKII